MKRTITIDPITRIEGHARVFLDLDEAGGLASAGLVVNELRGFERILVGMPADRMPLITARICGVCPSAHHLAASKALDVAAGVEPPPAGALLRELLYMGHVIHSHALSLFVLQGPDLVLGIDADPAVRNVMGIVQAVPDVAKKALRLRTLGQKINETVGGRGIHPVTSIAGGLSSRMDGDRRASLAAWAAEAVALVTELSGVARGLLMRQLDAHPSLLDWVLPMWSLGTVLPDGSASFYDGRLRAVDATGATRAEFASHEYDRLLTEEALDWSYMKPVRIRDGADLVVYRVGPLARVNSADRMGTALADRELEDLRRAFGRPVHQTVLQVWARLVELIYACERARDIVDDPVLMGESRVPVAFGPGRAVGHVEAPRGVLVHEYDIDEQGLVRGANLLVATQQNYAAINRSVEQAAATHVVARDDDALLNAIEFAIRCYDPCLSCATHAVGQMPLEVVVRQGGHVQRVARR
jgi:F420-non-reducing hydrogenase large subunit